MFSIRNNSLPSYGEHKKFSVINNIKDIVIIRLKLLILWYDL